jgi:ribose transport system permease protein
VSDAVVTASADELGAEAAEAVPRAPWWQRVFTGTSTWIGLILVGLVVAFSLLEPSSFLTVANGRNVATDAAVLLVLAVGMTFVIVTAGIDLSIGGVLVFAGVVAAKAMNGVGGEGAGVIVLGLAVALLAGAAWGALNGLLVARARIPALIVTLGTLGMSLGGALVITGGVDVREVPLKLITSVGTGRIAGRFPGWW